MYIVCIIFFYEMAQNFTKTTRRLVSSIANLNKSPYHNFRVLNGYHQTNFRNPTFVTPKRWQTNVCWRCGAHEGSPTQVFCEKCNVIQRPHELENYFKLFGLEERFDIEQQVLRNKFRQLQSLLHPDKFSNKTEEEQAISADYSSLLNKAYGTLHVPLRRAEHLLKLKGETIGESQSVDDPEFLIEIMTLNEEASVEEVGKDVGKLKKLNKKNNEQLERVSREIDLCFKSNDIEKAKENIIKFKYYTSLSSRINGTLRDLGESD
ncbi:hypothetical protein NQ318_005757 [Aromia moschata]|uniref:J domain-containing protein n=1 Tax=Aromia moschata TaxID=1265417 RepID=A0AAV8YR11_9CUCU|nr:hypothetical protein NQ318_005757 [Aromia moschata]